MTITGTKKHNGDLYIKRSLYRKTKTFVSLSCNLCLELLLRSFRYRENIHNSMRALVQAGDPGAVKL